MRDVGAPSGDVRRRTAGTSSGSPLPRPVRDAKSLRQVYACAGLFALGAGSGVLCVLAELRFHVVGEGVALTLGGAALCGGLALGLWLPRCVIRHQLLRQAGISGSREKAPPAVDFEFAASLVGALLLVVALALGALVVYAGLLETWRAFLTRSFIWPTWLAQTVIVLPGLLLSCGVGILGGTVLIALHGWQRVVRAAGDDVGALWIVLTGGSAVGVVLGALWGESALVGVTALLATLCAAIVAVAWRGSGAARAPATLIAADAAISVPWCAALATGGFCVALSVTGSMSATGCSLVTTLSAQAIGAFCGVFAAWGLHGRGVLPASAVAPLLGLVGLACAFGHATYAVGPSWLPLLSMSTTTSAGAVLIAAVAAQVARETGRVQTALAQVGGVTSGAYACGLLTVFAWGQGAAGRDLNVLAVLLLVAAAVLGLLLDARLTTRGRWAVVSAMAGAPLLVGLGAGPDEQVARGWAGASAWTVDLGGPRDALIEVDTFADEFATSPETALRLMKRAARAVKRGGRIVIKQPTRDWLVAGAKALRAGGLPEDAAVHELRGSTTADDRQLMVGADVEAWLAAQSLRPEGARWEVVRKRTWDEDTHLTDTRTRAAGS